MHMRNRLTDVPPLSSLPICCNNDNRGVAVGKGKVFNRRLDATLVALDAAVPAIFPHR